MPIYFTKIYVEPVPIYSADILHKDIYRASPDILLLYFRTSKTCGSKYVGLRGPQILTPNPKIIIDRAEQRNMNEKSWK